MLVNLLDSLNLPDPVNCVDWLNFAVSEKKLDVVNFIDSLNCVDNVKSRDDEN